MTLTPDDVDWTAFSAEDASPGFSDDFDVRINLTASDPNLFCAWTDSARQGLVSMNEATCDIRSDRHDGSPGTDEGADFDITVQPTCTTSSLSMQNG